MSDRSKLKFNLRSLKELQIELDAANPTEILEQVANMSVDVITKAYSIGLGIEINEVYSLDMPLIEMTNQVITALNVALFGSEHPPKPPAVQTAEPEA